MPEAMPFHHLPPPPVLAVEPLGAWAVPASAAEAG